MVAITLLTLSHIYSSKKEKCHALPPCRGDAQHKDACFYWFLPDTCKQTRVSVFRRCSRSLAMGNERRAPSPGAYITWLYCERTWRWARATTLHCKMLSKHWSVISLLFNIVAVVVLIYTFNDGRPFPFSENSLIFNECRSSANIQGTTGRIYGLKQVRTFNGKRALSSANSCKPFSTKPGRKCDRWIVVTTIYPETPILHKISSLSGWCMVVVADKKGPVSMNINNVDYLDVVQQESCGYHICRLLPWNHFGRKNIGYLYAIEHGAKMIYDTDDDNEPLLNVVPAFDNVGYSHHVKIQSHLWNPYPRFGTNTKIWPRGFPLGHITDATTKKETVYGKATGNQVGVVQYLAQHDPDVDAIYRLTNELPYEFNPSARRYVVPEQVLSPYNAQTTLHAYDAFWGMLLPVTVHGRVSDIWRSYFTQRLMWDIGKRLAFHSPFVVQKRNPHNYMADFDSEMDLYYKAENLVEFLLRFTTESPTTLPQKLLDLAIKLYEYEFIGAGDVSLTEAWIQDLQCLGYTFPALTKTSN
ncbi:probable glycosyltransferase STELLO2 [Acanthaster planci]|uniref:Probable glycosyltransferase STELLO2 n=1 Tax=Acanthaster planci TaxID=133434 RepID=A0A8B7ZB34_ACAPL|nr:probable glycosyltransferase STELLO2 [Acanthaster planci]